MTKINKEALAEIKGQLSNGYLDISSTYDEEYIEVVLNALDCMEKLEKIEQIINSWYPDNPRDIIHWEKMRMIEQIVKG